MTTGGFSRVDHARFNRVQRDIFRLTFVADCMSHSCCDKEQKALKPQHLSPTGHRNDACCQYGADTDLGERDAILARTALIQPHLPAHRRDPAAWFADEPPTAYSDFPSGFAVRTRSIPPQAHDPGGCTFLALAPDRGCVLHRVALEQSIPLIGFKPLICQLYPVTFDDDTIYLSDDFDDYDCGRPLTGPTVYQVLRPTLASAFGDGLVTALDRAGGIANGGSLPMTTS